MSIYRVQVRPSQILTVNADSMEIEHSAGFSTLRLYKEQAGKSPALVAIFRDWEFVTKDSASGQEA